MNECGFAPDAGATHRDRSGASGWPQTLTALIPALFLLGLALVHGPQAGSLDDAFVVWSDARDLIGADGSPSELGASGISVPVEGATSLLDVALKGVVLRVWPTADPLRVAGLMGILWLLLLLLVAARATWRWTASVALTGSVACLFAVAPGLVESAGYLLEGPLFALLWTLALVAAVDGRPGLCSFWGLLLAAARPEGLPIAPILVAWAAWRSNHPGGNEASSSKGGARIWGWGLTGLACAGVVTAFRWWRFEEIVPNTYYAKSSDSAATEILDGLGYVRGVVWGSPGPLWSSTMIGAALLLTAGWLMFRRQRGEPHAAVRGRRGLLTLSGLYALGVIVSGGDSYEGARLFMPIVIPLWLGLALSRSPLVVALVATVALLPGALGGSGLDSWRRPASMLATSADALVQGPVGLDAYAGDAETFRAVATALGSDGVFAHVHTQRFRWFEPRASVLDLTGLTDRRIARLPQVGPVRFGRFALREALEQQVGAIHLDPQRARPSSIVDAPSLVDALAHPTSAARYIGEPFVEPDLAAALSRDYLGASRVLPGGQGFFNLLVHRSRAEAFRAQGFRVAASTK
jgi:hypothetical protein